MRIVYGFDYIVKFPANDGCTIEINVGQDTQLTAEFEVQAEK